MKNPLPRTPQFYMSPKIHKEGNPGRPVVSSIYCHTAKTSKYVDYHLQPIVKHLKLLKDSTPYSQALWIKQICSLQQEFLSHTGKIINQFQKRGYDKSLIEQQIKKANLQEREQLLKEKKETAARSFYGSNIIEHSQKYKNC